MTTCTVISYPQSEPNTSEGDREAGVTEEDSRSHAGLRIHER